MAALGRQGPGSGPGGRVIAAQAAASLRVRAPWNPLGEAGACRTGVSRSEGSLPHSGSCGTDWTGPE